MKSARILTVSLALTSLSIPACRMPHEAHAEEVHHKVVATSPKTDDVVITQQYVCRLHSQRHIKICALQGGYIEEVAVKEGQSVKKGDVLFKVIPTLYKARYDAELAEAKLAELELSNANRLMKDNIVSPNEVALFQAKLSKAKAKAKLAEAELNFTVIVSPFDGIVDRVHEQLGSLVKEGEVLTTLSDNSVMWAYFNVPEARYLEYMAEPSRDVGGREIELILANGEKYGVAGKIGAIEADFNSETGNIPFRADFPNPTGLLRHGQTGNVLIHRMIPKALVIPQRAVFEILDKRYVYVLDKEGAVRQREIVVQHEMDDVYVLRSGLDANDRFILDGVRQVRDGDKKEVEFRDPAQVIGHQKNKAE
ncbi:MAG: efflux RND transporter periplasmic adaptor subunit [Gemmataceae bacterium]